MSEANIDFPAVREIAGIQFQFGENENQFYYQTFAEGLIYNIARNKNESYWWIWSHLGTSVLTLNKTYVPCSIPGLQDDIEYVLYAVALYINKGINPHFKKRQELSFMFNLEAEVLQAVRPESFDEDLLALIQAYNAEPIKAFSFPDGSHLVWDNDNQLIENPEKLDLTSLVQSETSLLLEEVNNFVKRHKQNN
ncbi:hypothetical protein FD723_40430 (plasmid) [Nostoc sp. C052]|uniref:hypothetical protein n=1 Tax=Nostoc sp. C052 TaxID=2576902 RepID=UPI0015C3EFCD|nr:hypothetical protein [Nostoc sp. C052]QLE46481.1 hypothetical protein FD723_40430 [Nostoc sp. C052]